MMELESEFMLIFYCLQNDLNVSQGYGQLHGLQLIQLHRKVCRVLPIREMKCRLVVF